MCQIAWVIPGTLHPMILNIILIIGFYSLSLGNICDIDLSVVVRVMLDNSSVYDVQYLPQTLVQEELIMDCQDFCYKLNRYVSIKNNRESTLNGCEDMIYSQSAILLKNNFDFIEKSGFNSNDCYNNFKGISFSYLTSMFPPSPFTAKKLKNIIPQSQTINKTCDELTNSKSDDILALNSLIKPNDDKMKSLDMTKQTEKCLCIVYTMESNHNDRVHNVVHSWGSRCDGLIVFSTKTVRPFIISIPHEGEESYENIWAKIVSIWKYVYSHYRNEFQWYFKHLIIVIIVIIIIVTVPLIE